MLAHKRKLLFMLGLCSFLAPFIGRSIDLCLPAIGNEFDMTIISLSWVITAYLLATAVLLVPFGRLADIIGRKKIFIAGSCFFTVTSFLCSIAYSGKFLIAARILQGIASAMALGTATALLVTIFAPRERGKARGITTAGVYLGSSLGPSLGGIMTQYLGWRSLFVMTTLLSTIVVIMSFLYLTEESTDAHGERFDVIGSILYACATIALLYGTTMLPALTGYLVIAAGIALFIIFGIAEEYIKHPVFDIDLLLKNKAFAMSNLAALLNFSAAFAVPFLMSLYLQYIKGLAPKTAGLIILASPITMVMGSPIAGRISDRIDPRIVATFGMACSSTALFMMSFVITPTTPLYLLMGILFIFGGGLSIFASPNANAAMGVVSKKQLGIAASVLNTTRLFGQVISMGISTLVLSLIVGKVEISDTVLPQLMKSIQLTFFIFGLLCFIGIFASLARGQRTKEE